MRGLAEYGRSGLSACDPRAWRGADWGLVACTLLGCGVGRVLNIVPLAALLNMCLPRAERISIRMQVWGAVPAHHRSISAARMA